MSLAALILALVTLQRIAELALSARNTRRLKEQGGIEVGAGHYPLIVAVHAAWLGGLWWLAWDGDVVMVWLFVFLALQAARIWVVLSLGARWTTRIIVLPGAPLVTSGPYRFLRHPNYVVVAAEIAVLPLVFGLPVFAAVFTLLNAAVLAVRIRAENRALAPAPTSAGGRSAP